MFAIIESGRRVSLPIDRLLRSELSSVSPVTAAHRVTPEPGRLDPRRALTAYEGSEEPPARQRLRIAAELMTSPARTLASTDTVAQAWQLLLNGRFHHVPVTAAGGLLAGIVSDRDLLRAAAHEQGAVDQWLLADVMQRRVIVAAPETPLRSLAEVMVARRIGAVPIVDPGSHPVGIVSRADLLRALVGQAPLDIWG